MPEFSINGYAVLTGVVVKMLIGTLWYSPLLFVKRCLAIVGVSEAQMQANLARCIIVDLAGTIVTGFAMAGAVFYVGAQGGVAPGSGSARGSASSPARVSQRLPMSGGRSRSLRSTAAFCWSR